MAGFHPGRGGAWQRGGQGLPACLPACLPALALPASLSFACKSTKLADHCGRILFVEDQKQVGCVQYHAAPRSAV